MTDSGSGGSMGKMIIPMMAIFGLGISLLAVLINALFFPTVNRKSDFCAYDLPVISEVSMAGIREGRSDE